MSLIGLPALAIVVVGVHLLASLAVRAGAPDSRGFVTTVFKVVVGFELAREVGVLAAIAGTL